MKSSPASVTQKRDSALGLRCIELAENRKAEDPLFLDLRGLSTIADYFVIVSGTSEPHLRAIVEEIEEHLEQEEGIRPVGKDGTPQTGWIVLDYFDVMVHIMRADVRARFDLESLWGDAPRLPIPRTLAAGPKGR